MEQILKRRDILLVPFPFSDQSGAKQRPALVISNDVFNEKSQDLLVCGMTSNLDNAYFTVFVKQADWKDGLYSESCVKVASILTIDKKIVLKRIGRLSGERFNEVLQKLQEIVK